MNSNDLSGMVWSEHTILKQFPFHIGETVGVSENSRLLHWHNEMEICYIRQGTGRYLINGYDYSFSAGDIFIINNDQIHLAYNDEDLVMLVMMFQPSFIWPGGLYVMDYDYLRPFMDADVNFSSKLDHNHEHIPMVADILTKIEEEYKLKPEGYKLMIKSLLLCLMTTIIRYFRKDSDFVSNKKANTLYAQKLKCAIEYISEHYKDTIKLEDLAIISNMSVSYFCHMFKNVTGIAPMDYILRRRITAAKEMLTNTDAKILEVATGCGFNSLSNFNKFFKSFTGMSPKQYRVN